MTAFKCFFCKEPAHLIGYYQKTYSNGKDTIENPTLFCEQCWNDRQIRNQIHCHRGGIDGVYCLNFKTISQFPKKKIGWMLSKRGFEINHISNKTWRKIFWRIFYSNQPPKRRLDDTPTRKCSDISTEI